MEEGETKREKGVEPPILRFRSPLARHSFSPQSPLPCCCFSACLYAARVATHSQLATRNRKPCSTRDDNDVIAGNSRLPCASQGSNLVCGATWVYLCLAHSTHRAKRKGKDTFQRLSSPPRALDTPRTDGRSSCLFPHSVEGAHAALRITLDAPLCSPLPTR
jgi:hypothetical protein